MRNKILNDKKGVLLLEVLLGVAIISVSLTMIIKSLLTSMRATVFSADYTKATIVQDNLFFDLVASPEMSLSFTQGDDCGKPFEDYQCQLEQESSFGAGGAGSEGLKEVSAVVSWQSGKNLKRLSATTLVLGQE